MSVTISKAAAAWIIRAGRDLFESGTGQLMNPLDNELEDLNDAPALFDRIPMEDHELWHWANALLHFARSVSAIIAHDLVESEKENMFELEDDVHPDEI